MMTLEEAQDFLISHFEEGAVCPCCGQLVKLYKRKLDSFMAYALILIYRYFRQSDVEPWLHVPSYLIAQGASDRECAKLRYWGLIEEMANTRPDGGRAGLYRISQRGIDFVEGRCSVPKYIYLYNQMLIDRGDEADSARTTIHEALAERFDYQELMNSGVATF